MTARRLWSRRGPVSVLVAVVAVGLLAGCTGQRDPGSYTAGVKKNFVGQCWLTRVLDLNPDVEVELSEPLTDQQKTVQRDAPSDDVAAAKDACSCTYAAIKKDVKFSTFKSINSDLRDDPGRQLPESFTKAYADCDLAPQA